MSIELNQKEKLKYEKKSKKKTTMHCPPIPIGHLTIPEFAELKKQVLKITGHEIVLVAKDKNGKIVFKE